MNRALRWIMGILLSPIILFLLLTAALYIPTVQDWAVNTASRLATRDTGLTVTVERVGLSFPLDIDMRRVLATDAQGDTILSVHRLVAHPDISHLLILQLGLDEVSLHDGCANTKELIEGLSVRGTLHRLAVAAPHGIDLGGGIVNVSDVSLDGCDLHVVMGDMPADTTESTPLPWQVNVQRLDINDTRLSLNMDSLWAMAHITQAQARRIAIDLEQERYSATALNLDGTAQLWMPAISQDTIDIPVVGLSTDRAAYSPTEASIQGLKARIRQSAIELSATAALTQQDCDTMPHGHGTKADDCVRAANSVAQLSHFEASLSSSIDRSDMLWAAAIMGVDTTLLSRTLPHEPLDMALEASGNTQSVTLQRAWVQLPTVVNLQASGQVENIDSLELMDGCIDFQAQTYNMEPLRRAFMPGSDVRVPRMAIVGRATVDEGRFKATARMSVEGRQVATLDAGVDARTMAYNARMNITGLAPRSFMPSLPMGPVTATVTAQGVGTDFYSMATHCTARAEVKRCSIDSLELRDVCMAANYSRRKASLLIDCNNRLIDGNIGMSALVEGRDKVTATFALDLTRADLYGLRIVPRPLQVSGNLHLDGGSDLRSSHQLRGVMRNIALLTADTVMYPKDLTADVLLQRDTVSATATAGDLSLGFTAGCGVDALMDGADAFATALKEQLAQYRIDQEALRLLLPQAEVRLTMGQHNPAAYIAHAMGYDLEALRVRLGADPAIGLNGGVSLSKLTVGAVTLDEMWCNIFQDSTGVKMEARVHNVPSNPQISFDARANAYIHPTGASVGFKFVDDKGRLGVDVGSNVEIQPDGVKMHLTPLNPIVANRTFTVNEDNYLFLSPDGRVQADIDLLADDGTGMKLYSAPEDTAAVAEADSLELPRTLQDLTLSLHNVNVQELCEVVPYMPRLSGMMWGDLHLVQTTQTMSVAADMGVDDLKYEGVPLGDVSIDATYLPVGDSCHYVDGLLSMGGEELAALSGHYTDGGAQDGEGQLEVEGTLTRLPLDIIGDLAGDPTMVSMSGEMDGTMALHGSLSQLRMDGMMTTRGAMLSSPAYNVRLRIQDDTVRVTDSRLELRELRMYSTGKRPLSMSGWVDFKDFGAIRLDTRLKAQGFELINAKRSVTSVAYGKVLVDADATLRGTLQSLNMRGRLGVLGGTNVTYILQDSPLTVEDRLGDMVQFVDFSDTIARSEPQEAPAMSLTMDMQVSVDQSAQVHCLLSADRSSYIDLEGGGELALGYTPQGDMTLSGQYTIISGEMKYALPIIPLKTFKLQSGSNVSWTGNMMNPQLDIAATERMRAPVSSESGPNRQVTFDVGVAITQTLENIGLAFTIEAPDDATIQNELQAMDATARGRVAVTMLATGMYINDTGSSGGFSTTNALGTFLQSEISNITGKALGSLDVNVGVEEGTGTRGGQTTDYSFSFAKRFWNNRISVSFGGRVSSGNDALNTGATIIDNVSLEYRLDQTATRYVRLSYDKNYESLLEGTITEMGAGLVLRRKTTRLGELFIFRRKKKDNPTPNPSPKGRGVDNVL